jgi:hypothetical protein
MAKRAAKINEQGDALKKEGAKWIARIEAAWKREDDWAKDAEKAVKAYTNEASGDGKLYDYNILHANTETIVPAIINSPPQPDIRRRFGDDDPVAKQLSDILERAIAVQVDDSRLATELEGQAQDGFLAGRGVIRIRFHADTQETETSALEEAGDAAEADDTGAGAGNRPDDEGAVPDAYESGAESVDEGADASGADTGDLPGASGSTVSNECIKFEAVSWRDYQHGPAKRWEDRPWESFRHVMQPEDVTDFADTGLVSSQTEPGGTLFGDADSDIVLYEIWDKRTRKVIFVSDNSKVLKKLPDPLGLTNFFPTSRPVQPIEIVGRLMPVTPFAIYSKLADELDIITKRIRAITAAMKVKGAAAGGNATDLKAFADADDNDMTMLHDFEALAQVGGIDKAITWWPVDKFQPVLAELFKNRDLTKQAIYEITGISDIVRGASSPSETLGAQQIKTQWGSLRIQKMQRMMERSARDLFVMMSEIIPAKFTYKTLEAMTAVPINIQPNDSPEVVQQKQQLQALMKQKIGTYYRVDVESESTIRADLTNKKKESAEFLTGAAAYFAAVGPLVQTGELPAEAAIEIFAANARLFNLGKSVEDTIEKMVTDAKAKAEELKKNPPPPKPSAEELKAQVEGAKAQAAGAKAQADGQKAAADAQLAQAALQLDQQKAAADAQLAAAKLKGEQEAKAAQIEADKFKAQLSAVTAIVVARIGAQTDVDSQSIEADLARELGLQTQAHDVRMAVIAHASAKDIQASAPKPKPNGAAK